MEIVKCVIGLDQGKPAEIVGWQTICVPMEKAKMFHLRTRIFFYVSVNMEPKGPPTIIIDLKGQGEVVTM